MRFQRALTVFIVLAGLSLDAHADADSLNDHLGPREIATGEASRSEARGALAVSLNPAGLALTRELVFEGGYGYRPGDAASTVAVSACDSTVPMPGCFYYRYLKASPDLNDMSFGRRTHEAGVSLARALSPRISLGITNRYFDYNSDLAGEEDASGWGTDAGLLVRATDFVNVGVVGYNLLSADSAQYPRAIGAGISARPAGQLLLAFDSLWNLEAPDGQSTGRYGGGAEYFFQSADMQNGFPIRVGGVYDAGQESGYLTGGLGYMHAKFAFDLGVRKQLSGEQMDGTSELIVVASIRLFGPRLAEDAPQQPLGF